MAPVLPITRVDSIADAGAEPGRVVFLDVLRVLIVTMVIVHHAAQAYGPTGGNWPVEDPVTSDWFLPFYTVNAAVGLGLLFLLAGYFVPRSYDGKGAGRFLSERWARIGVPLVVFAVGVHLPLLYLFGSRPPVAEFLGSLYEDAWVPLYLHLWFLGHLLLYTVAYLVWRRLVDRTGWTRRAWNPPGHRAILGFAVGLAVVTWVVRLWYPVDEWVPLLFVLAAEPASMTQYLSLFALGAVAYRNDWMRRMPTGTGMVWLGVGILSSAVVYVVGALGMWGDVLAIGGADWRSLARAMLEAFICAGLAVGLVVLCRQVFRRPLGLLSAMSKASYGAYILHIWVVVALQAAILGVPLPPLVKFAMVAVAGVAITFGLAHASRRVPGVRVALGSTVSSGRGSPPAVPGRDLSAGH